MWLSASERTGFHSVVSARLLSSHEVARLRRSLLEPESWEDGAGPLSSEQLPVRVLVVQAGERLLKLALYGEPAGVRFSDDGVHAIVDSGLSERGRTALDWLFQ